jgi:leader peptidase (prepilin peptidase) / N-methyltransferase
VELSLPMRGRLPPEFRLYYAVAAGVFGLVLGSFLNVSIYRIPRDLSVLRPRSFCPECGKQIAWYDNVPLLSYVMLSGRCRSCEKRIGLRYPIVELTTAVLFALVAVRYGWTWVALKWVIFEAMLVVLFCTDLEEQILPDEFTLGGTLVGLILAIFVMVPSMFGEMFFPAWSPAATSEFNAALGAVLLAGPIWLIGAVYAWVRKRQGLGFGDVKLLMLFGVFLGLENGLFALLVGTVAGSVIGLIYVFAARKKVSQTELPFGSFLCIGAGIIPLLSRMGMTFQSR